MRGLAILIGAPAIIGCLFFVSPAKADGWRNVLVDVESLIGSDVRMCAVQPKAGDYSSQCYLHCLVGSNASVPDYDTVHPHAYEFASQLPYVFAEGGTPTNTLNGLPILTTRPDTPAEVRNFFLDLEGIFGGGVLYAWAIAKKRDNQGHYLHLLMQDDGTLSEDLTDATAKAWEYLSDVPSDMRRADGGPLHAYAGIEVRLAR